MKILHSQLIINRKYNRNFQNKTVTTKLYIVGIQNFQDIFEIHKRTFISAFSICMTIPLKHK